MAYATIDFHHPQTGRIREAPVGFSWTTLFFGFLPALFRGHYLLAFIMAVIALFTGGFSWLVFPFLYNRMYIRHLLGEGYKVTQASWDLDEISRRLKISLPLYTGQASLARPEGAVERTTSIPYA